MKVEVYWYILTDSLGDKTHAICGFPNDSIQLSGIDAMGKYQQFDSTEAYHSHAWAKRLGFKLECGVKQLELNHEK